MIKLPAESNQRGAVPLILLIAVLGLLGFFVVTSIAPFNNKLFSNLFPKEWSFAAAGDEITPGTLTLNTTFKSIAMEILFTGDNNRNATADLEFKKSSDANWRKGLPLWRVDPDDNTSGGVPDPIDTYGRAFYGSALLLDHNTQYDIRVTVKDPDGGNEVITGSIQTRNDNIPTAAAAWTNAPGNLKYYVRTNGNDANDGKTEATAWKTFDKAVTSAPTDAVIQFGPGYYLSTLSPKTSRNLPATFLAQFPATDDLRNPINPTQRTVIMPGDPKIGKIGMTCPAAANDCPNPEFKNVWQEVTLSGPGRPENLVPAGTPYKVWKWTGPITDPANLGYSSTKDGIPQRVASWKFTVGGIVDPLYTPEYWAEKMYTNLSYNHGFYANGKDIYLRIPTNAPSSDPNDLYITVGTNKVINPVEAHTALTINADNVRFSGFEVRNMHYGVMILAVKNAIIDHNYFQMVGKSADSKGDYNAHPNKIGSDHVYQYNLIVDTNIWSDDPVNKPAIPWNFIKVSDGSIKNADNTQFSTNNGTGIGTQAQVGGLGAGAAKNVVIRNNTVDGSFNGIGASIGDTYERYATSNVDIYNNLIQHIGDDGIEPEGDVINFKAWNNTLNHSSSFTSTGSVNFGPVYYFRNTGWRMGAHGAGKYNDGQIQATGKFFKYSGKSIPAARVYVVNNTFWSDVLPPYSPIGLTGGAKSASNGTHQEAFYFRNNIMRASRYAFSSENDKPFGINRYDEDYNFFATTDDARGLQARSIDFTSIDFTNPITTGAKSLAEYRLKTGQGAHTNRIANVDYNFISGGANFVDSQLTAPTAGNVSVKSTASFIDSGIVVANIADSFSGCAPDIGNSDQSSGAACPSPSPIPLPSISPTPIPSASPSQAPMPAPDGSGAYRIDSAATTSRVDDQGKTWSADGGYIGGGVTNRSTAVITGTNNPWLYQTERYNLTGYQINVPNGTYTLRMHFAEVYAGVTASGQRIFNISAEGGNQISNFDVFQQAGGKNIALVKELTVNVTDGKLDISFTKVSPVEPPMIDGLEIIPPTEAVPGYTSRWKFDDCSGTTALNTGNGSLNAILNIRSGGTQIDSGSCTTAGTAWGNGVQGKFDSSLNLDGVDDYASAPNSALPTGDLTLSIWINPITNNDEAIVMSSTTGGGNEFLVFLQNADILVHADNITNVAATTGDIIPAGQWSHIAVTKSGSNYTIYVNGVQKGSGTNAGVLDFGTCQLLIGTEADGAGCETSLGNYFNGKIDEMRIYNRALSNSEISLLSNIIPAPSAFPTVQPSPSKPGDIDGNNKVDIFDYNTLLTNFRKTGTNILGDLDNNGKVDIFDYNILLTNFGK